MVPPRVPKFVSARETLYTSWRFVVTMMPGTGRGGYAPNRPSSGLNTSGIFCFTIRGKHSRSLGCASNDAAHVKLALFSAAFAPSRMASRLDFAALLLFGHGTRRQIFGELRELLPVLIRKFRCGSRQVSYLFG